MEYTCGCARGEVQIFLADQFGEMPELANGLAWKASGVKAARGRNSLSPPRGLAERFIALASKARGCKSSRGSNPLPSASYYAGYRTMVSPSVCGTEHISSILIILPNLSSCGGIGIHNGLKIHCRKD